MIYLCIKYDDIYISYMMIYLYMDDIYRSYIDDVHR